MSQELYDFLRQRSRLKSVGWPLCLGLSLAVHGLVAAAILIAPKTEAAPEEPKVTWVNLPAAGATGPLGGSAPMEEGKQGERLRRCSLHVFDDGRLVPFCARYLTGWRP